uniref:Kyphoscoliosis peptidase n=1 Tax=Oryzias sinensis TaxID=183150 RepID=A0A8C7Z5X9_9TELE
MSADVAIQKFSFPFTRAVKLSAEGKATCTQVKSSELSEPQKSPTVNKPSPATGSSALMHDETQKQGSTKLLPEADMAGGLVSACDDAAECAVVSSQSMCMSVKEESEDQRPAAKRQLSSESAARTVTTVKKSAVRQEVDQPRQARSRIQPAPCAAVDGKRKRRKDLFSSSEVFHRIDSRVIRTGLELKERHVYDVKTIVHSITRESRNELDRLRAIWVWLCHNIEYDVSGYLGHSEKLSSLEEVIAAGRGVCCSYSSLCMEMCREVGIECQEVPGHSKGVGYRQGQSLRHVKSDHLWNAVLLGGQWFLLDACWGAGRVDMEHESFVRRFDDFYFLTDPEEFIESHFPEEEKWQLLDTPIILEDFEKRVFKTSAFFTLGLRLINPHHFHIVTDDGEANVSIGFSSPTTFTYEITQHRDLLHCGALEQKESSTSSFGILTVSHRSMNLQLLPPATGSYDCKVFARHEKASTPLVWVCSFTVECLAPRAREVIPENPYLSWGMQPVAASLGVADCSQSREVAEMEAALAKRCLATQIQPDILLCHVLCPFPGFYRLSVFVRDYEKSELKFQNAANFLLHCKGKVFHVDELFPPNLGSACGPGTRTAQAGLSKFSHNASVVSTQQGKCNITFHNQRDLELHCTLSREESKAPAVPLSRHLLCTYTDTKVTVSISLPEVGVYRLGLYARVGPGGEFSPMCDFVLRNSCALPGPPFPCLYSAWRKGCVLFEPRAGLLDPLSRVHFRVRVPGALRLAALNLLHLSRQHIRPMEHHQCHDH